MKKLKVETGENIKFFVCGDVNPPKRNTGEDAGFDLFVPNLSEQFIKDLAEKNPGSVARWGVMGAPKDEEEAKKGEGLFLYLLPNEDLLIPTYIKSRMPSDYCLRISNKSGVATKQKLIVGAEIVDSSYEGIIHMHVINTSNRMQMINFGQKLCQAIPIKINNLEHEVFYDNKIEQFKEFKNFVSEEDFYDGHKSDRGSGGFGSTGLTAEETK